MSMSPSPLATTSITGSALHHHADVRRPHGGFASYSVTYSSFYINGPGSYSSFPLVRSPHSSSGPKARPPRGPRGSRSQDLPPMAAVRPKLAVLPSSEAENTRSKRWEALAEDFLELKSPDSPAGPATFKSGPSVKKMRRRVALLSGVHLNLPNSPVVGSPPPGSSRAWTFTAEWDSTQDEFVFSDLESSGSGSSSASSSSTPASARSFGNPIPFDVSDDIDMLSPLTKLSIASRLQELASGASVTSSSSASDSPPSPAVSDIFDLYISHTPSTNSFPPSPSSDSNDSSTTPSPINSPSLHLSPSSPPPGYMDSCFQPPVISVTFYEDDESQQVNADRVLVAPASAFESSLWATLVEKPSLNTQVPRSAEIPSPRKPRPLPPVPVRAASLSVS